MDRFSNLQNVKKILRIRRPILHLDRYMLLKVIIKIKILSQIRVISYNQNPIEEPK